MDDEEWARGIKDSAEIDDEEVDLLGVAVLRPSWFNRVWSACLRKQQMTKLYEL